MKKLTIHNPVNILGNNFAASFRGGELAKEVVAEEEVQLIDVKGQDLCYGEILDIWTGQLGHVPALLIEMSNDPLQRTFTGLHTHLMMYRKNTSEATPLTTVVTILILKPKESTIIRPSGAQVNKLSC